MEGAYLQTYYRPLIYLSFVTVNRLMLKQSFNVVDHKAELFFESVDTGDDEDTVFGFPNNDFGRHNGHNYPL